MKKALSLIVSVALLATFVGCSNETAETTAAEETTTTAAESTDETTTADETEATEASKAESFYTFTDAYGNEVVIAEEPQKVVSVSPTLTEIVYALGMGDKMIAVSDYDDYPSDVFSLETVGAIDTPDFEKIVSLEPDVVIASSIFSEDSYNTLTDLGITVAIVKDEESLDGTYDVISTIGAILGATEEADALNADIKDRLDAITVVATEDAPTVYYCMGFGEWGEYTAGTDTFINDMIEAAGAKNAAQVEGWAFSVEALIEADPDIILLSTWCDYDAFTTSEPYSELSAVKNGTVYSVDGNLFERQGPRNVEGIELIADCIADMAEDAAA